MFRQVNNLTITLKGLIILRLTVGYGAASFDEPVRLLSTRR